MDPKPHTSIGGRFQTRTSAKDSPRIHQSKFQ
jgi:hypothetical protein